jgi:glutamine amidotransferase
MITLVAPGSDGLAALEGALDHLGYAHLRAAAPGEAAPSGPLLLAGAGPFEPACAALKRSGFWWELPQLAGQGRPVMGIGLGLHLLAEGSEEDPKGSGLALLPGIVRSLGRGVKVPHLGWARLRRHREHRDLPDPRGAWMYFRHAHALEPDSLTLLTSHHGRPFSALEMRGSTLGLQAHPERSGDYGLALLDRLLRLAGESPREGATERLN